MWPEYGVHGVGMGYVTASEDGKHAREEVQGQLARLKKDFLPVASRALKSAPTLR